MTDRDYIKLILGHIGIGFCIFLLPVLAKLYAALVIIIGLYFVFKNKNHNNEVLYISGYITGCEVFLRTVGGNPFHEYGRYFILLFVILGLFYKGIPKKINPYLLFLLLLIPSIFININGIHDDIRRKIFFDILGPVTLGFVALYTFKRKITFEEINTVLLAIGLPILSYCTFLFLKYPLEKAIINNTESNLFLSGEFAPNQAATTLGLGVFVFLFRIFTASFSKRILIINVLAFSFIYYRGLMTFSRGGMITGIVIIAIFLIHAFIKRNDYHLFRIKFGLVSLLFPVIFVLASFQTGGLLTKRYLNQNPSGLYKSPEVNGREDMALEEIRFFKEHPMSGVGVGKIKEIRKEKYKSDMATHNEITRMLAEHGILGIISLLILFLTPAFLYLKNRQNIYLICFFAFWLLTINHSAMRVAAPSFIYALALFSIKLDTEEVAVSSV